MDHAVSDIEKVKRAEQQELEAKALEINDLKLLLSMPEGRRFMKRLMLETCRIFDGAGYHPSGSEMYYNSGSRSVGLNIKEQVEALSPHAFLEILQEEL